MVTYFTGISGRCQFWNGTNYSGIGAVSEFLKTYRVRKTVTGGVATRKRSVGRITEVIPALTIRYVPKDFNLLTGYLIKDDEGSLSKFSLRYYDGQEYGEVYNIAPETVEVATGQGREIQISLNGMAENSSNGIVMSSGSWAAEPSDPAMVWRQTQTLKVYGTDLKSHFREWSFRVTNNAIADVAGNVIRPAEVAWGKADYAGRIEIAKSIASFEGNILNASRGSVQIAFQTRAASPVRKTFTFEHASLLQNEVRLPMDLVVHRIEWESNSLNISTG